MARPRGSSTGGAPACPAEGCRFESGPWGPGHSKTRCEAGLRVTQEPSACPALVMVPRAGSGYVPEHSLGQFMIPCFEPNRPVAWKKLDTWTRSVRRSRDRVSAPSGSSFSGGCLTHTSTRFGTVRTSAHRRHRRGRRADRVTLASAQILQFVGSFKPPLLLQ